MVTEKLLVIMIAAIIGAITVHLAWPAPKDAAFVKACGDACGFKGMKRVDSEPKWLCECN